jgi:hypothetical protein
MVDTMMLEHQEMLIFASLAPSVQGQILLSPLLLLPAN